jgi:LCP family protein required for cell wall assembly
MRCIDGYFELTRIILQVHCRFDLDPYNRQSLLLLTCVVALVGAYAFVLAFNPAVLPPAFRLGGLQHPTNILLLGTDVVYTDLGNRTKKINQEAFTGRSDTIMLVRLDPLRNTFGLLAIPRDTEVYVPGNGIQKANSANAIGGHNLAIATVSNFLQLPIDHYVVLNVHGLVELVNELGGITVEVPKTMHYMDWTAKLKIDLSPGYHTLTGNQAMGFVRFRHDSLGDIGRVQRQELFLRAVMDKAKQPSAWVHLPNLLSIASKYVDTDLSVPEMMGMATFVKCVPKSNQTLAMLPGEFAGNGNWRVSSSDVRRMVARLEGTQFINTDRRDLRVSIQNSSSIPQLALSLSKYLRQKGYCSVNVKRTLDPSGPHSLTRIIAQKGNTEDADQVKLDLGSKGEVVTASLGDIESSVTIVAGDDMRDVVNPVR